MAKELFLPKKEEKEVISIRMPSALLRRVDESAADYDMSRNEFLNQCVQFALDHLDNPQQS